MKRIITITFILLIISLPVLAQESGIIFSHKFHAQEVEALCSDCHGKALESVSSVDNLLPAMETCYNCHSEEDTDCTVCHADPDNFGVANRVTGFAANFPHAVHASSDSQCLTCHEGIVKKDKVTDVAMNLPQNTVCQTCHEPVDYAENKAMCVQCHSATMSFKPVTIMAVGEIITDSYRRWTISRAVIATSNRTVWNATKGIISIMRHTR